MTSDAQRRYAEHRARLAATRDRVTLTWLEEHPGQPAAEYARAAGISRERARHLIARALARTTLTEPS